MEEVLMEQWITETMQDAAPIAKPCSLTPHTYHANDYNVPSTKRNLFFLSS